jgi:hypothetical protein
VWLTPILTDEPTVAAAAPCLRISGIADKVRDGRLARSLTPNVLKIDRADHGMLVPGHLSESATVLGQVTTTLENFLDHQLWPPGPGQGNS